MTASITGGTPTRHIFAFGDNAYRNDPNTPLGVHREVIAATGKPYPRVLFIPTASGDSQEYIDSFYAFFGGRLGCQVSHLSLFRGEKESLESVIANQDLIYVGGGNTRNMLVLWKEWGLEPILRKAYERGVVMAGGSAGSLCWFESGVTDSIPGRFSNMKCMGWLQGSHCPHYNEFTRRPFYLEQVEEDELPSGYAVENGIALHFVNETLIEALSAIEGEQAYWVEKTPTAVMEMPIPLRRV